MFFRSKSNTRITSSVLFTMFSSFSFVSMNLYGNDSMASKATVEEARVKHFNVPEIERNLGDIPEFEHVFIDATPEAKNDGIPL